MSPPEVVENDDFVAGRSDATLNRGGVRVGTAEFYAVLDALPQVIDTMVLHFEDAGGMGKLVLLAEPEEGADRISVQSPETAKVHHSTLRAPMIALICSGFRTSIVRASVLTPKASISPQALAS